MSTTSNQIKRVDDRPLTRRASTAAMAIAAIIVSIAIGLGIAKVTPTASELLIGVTAVVLMIPIVVRIVRRRFDPFEPMTVFSLAYGVMFVLRPIAEIGRNQYVYVISGAGVAYKDEFTKMLVLAAIGAVAFTVGYELAWGKSLSRRMRSPSTHNLNITRAAWVACALGAFGVLLFAFFLVIQGGLSSFALVLAGRTTTLTEAVDSSSKYYWFGPFLLIPASLSLYALWRLERRRALLVASIASAVLLVVIRGPVGSRIALLPLFGGFVILYYLVRDRRPRAVTVVVLLSVALIVSAFIVSVRTQTGREQSGVAGAVTRVLTDPLNALDPLLNGQDSAEGPGFASALTLSQTELPRTYGRTVFGDLFLRPIPRSLWPEKPRPAREKAIAALWPRLYTVGAANPEFSGLFAWYVDWGWIGVACGLFLYGLAMRILYEYFLRNARNIVAQLIFALSVPMMVILLRDSLTDTLARAVFVVAPVLLIFWAGRHAALTELLAGRRWGSSGARLRGTARSEIPQSR